MRGPLTKPPPGVMLNHAHPLAFSAGWLFNEQAGSPVELVRQQPGAPTTVAATTKWGAGPIGPELTFGATTNYEYGQPAGGIPRDGKALTIAAVMTFNSVAAGTATFVQVGRGTEGGWAFSRATAGLAFTKVAVVDITSSGITLVVGVPYFVAAQVSASTVRFTALDLRGGGLQTSTVSNSAAIDLSPYPADMRVGAFRNAGSGAINGIAAAISLVYVWNQRCLTDNEIQALWSDPFAMLQPTWPWMIVAAAAGGSGVTVNVPLATLTTETFLPTISAPHQIDIAAPLSTIAFSTFLPSITSDGIRVDAPLASLALSTFVPAVYSDTNPRGGTLRRSRFFFGRRLGL